MTEVSFPPLVDPDPADGGGAGAGRGGHLRVADGGHLAAGGVSLVLAYLLNPLVGFFDR
jgi:hypothetical protein